MTEDGSIIGSICALPSREEQIARSYAAGETYQQIADRLNLAPSTVRTHLAATYRKLNVSSKLGCCQTNSNTSPSGQ